MIYLRMDGRIGNQLFMYSFAKVISKKRNNEIIVIDDSELLKKNYKNSLIDYNLKNVKYVHNHNMMKKVGLIKQNIIFTLYRVIKKQLSYNDGYKFEKKFQKFFNKNGLIICKNGYLEYEVPKTKNVFIYGYFQSSKYFDEIKSEIINELTYSEDFLYSKFKNIKKIKERNSVCISIKVEDIVDNSMYNVCDENYWKKSIEYICKNVKNPLFFICSDNIEYVKNNLIDCNKYDVVFQDSKLPVNVSLAIMGNCKHFIIGNTTFGWWAQYLSDNKSKIVVAPSKWMNIDMPIDIYEENWYLMEVQK